jgi:hypothetical protein
MRCVGHVQSGHLHHHFIKIQILLRYPPICFYIFIRLISLKNKDRKITPNLNCSFRYINDVLSLNNSSFGDYLHRIYPNDLEVNDITDTLISASYRDLHLEIDKTLHQTR